MRALQAVRAVAVGNIIAALAACSSPDGVPVSRWSGSVERVGGVDVVRNPGAALLSAEVVRLERLWIASDDSDDPHTLWQRPAKVSVGNGEVYVLDAGAKRVYAISSDGELLRTIGREGSGPGEFRRPFGVVRAGGTLVVGDGGRGAIEILSPQGSHLRSIPLGMVSFSLHGRSEREVVVSGLGTGATTWRVYDLESGSHRQISPPGEPSAVQEDDASCRRISATGQQVLVLNCTVPAFRVADVDGEVVREVRIDHPQRQLTATELAVLEEKVGQQVAQVGYPPDQARAIVSGMVADHRTVRSMQGVQRDAVSGVYLIWQQDPEEIGGGSPFFHVLSPEGVYLTSVPLAEDLVDFAVHDSVIYALAVDAETGLVRLAADRLRIPPAALATAATAVP